MCNSLEYVMFRNVLGHKNKVLSFYWVMVLVAVGCNTKTGSIQATNTEDCESGGVGLTGPLSLQGGSGGGDSISTFKAALGGETNKFRIGGYLYFNAALDISHIKTKSFTPSTSIDSGWRSRSAIFDVTRVESGLWHVKAWTRYDFAKTTKLRDVIMQIGLDWYPYQVNPGESPTGAVPSPKNIELEFNETVAGRATYLDIPMTSLDYQKMATWANNSNFSYEEKSKILLNADFFSENARFIPIKEAFRKELEPGYMDNKHCFYLSGQPDDQCAPIFWAASYDFVIDLRYIQDVNQQPRKNIELALAAASMDSANHNVNGQSVANPHPFPEPESKDPNLVRHEQLMALNAQLARFYGIYRLQTFFEDRQNDTSWKLSAKEVTESLGQHIKYRFINGAEYNVQEFLSGLKLLLSAEADKKEVERIAALMGINLLDSIETPLNSLGEEFPDAIGSNLLSGLAFSSLMGDEKRPDNYGLIEWFMVRVGHLIYKELEANFYSNSSLTSKFSDLSKISIATNWIYETKGTNDQPLKVSHYMNHPFQKDDERLMESKFDLTQGSSTFYKDSISALNFSFPSSISSNQAHTFYHMQSSYGAYMMYDKYYILHPFGNSTAKQTNGYASAPQQAAFSGEVPSDDDYEVEDRGSEGAQESISSNCN